MVPKGVLENLQWRKGLRKLCADPHNRASILAACRDSCLLWMNAFGWTYRVRKFNEEGVAVPIKSDEAHTPMVTWPVQDELVREIEGAMDSGEDVNCEKARDMGLSWLVLFIFDHRFLFHSNQSFGVVSRKESLVDSKGDMDSLFEKLRYIHRMLPQWMVPKINDRYMHMKNGEMNSTITGESTNSDVGRGGRKQAYLVDEGAAIPNGMDVESSLSQNTASQIWVSTPKGPSTQFHIRIKEGRGRRVIAPWYRHPEKSLGAHQVRDVTGRIRWTSPWYEKLPDRMSRKMIAQEVDCDHGKAGDLFFPYEEIERHRADHQREPLSRGSILPTSDVPQSQVIEWLRSGSAERWCYVPDRNGPWRFWFEMEDSRPPQHHTYIFAADISNGAGESNSVLTVLAADIDQIVAKWWSANTSPEDFAILVASAGTWFGGARGPAFVCWENNGPGGIFGRKLVKLGYPHYYRQRIDNTTRNKRTPRWGWNSNRERKEVCLGLYRDALSTDRIMNPCKESLDEATDYIYTDTGQLIPACLREEPGGGRELHGDHVIADALTVLAREELPQQLKTLARPPAMSYEHRRKMHKRRLREQDPWKD